LELKRLQEEIRAEEEKARVKKESEAAIEKYKREQAEKEAKEKKEKEEREKEYQHRLEDDLRKSGMDERQISVVLKKDKGVDPNRPTYTRMSRRHLSIETLNRYRIDYEFDQVRSIPSNFLAPTDNYSRILTTFSSRDGFPNTSKISCGPTPGRLESADNQFCSSRGQRRSIMRLNSSWFGRRSMRESLLHLHC